MNVLTKCSRYSESALKVLQKIDNLPPGTNLETFLSDLYICLLAHIKYLNDEFAVLFVNSNSSPATAKIFRALRKNTSAFSTDVIADLRSAASVAAAGFQHQAPPQGRGRGNYRRFQAYRGGHGDRGRGQRWHQQQHNNNDVYTPYWNRATVPTSRSQESQPGH